MPAGGFGNLIALPLQSRPRENANSVFLDDAFCPYDDQWTFLSIARRLSKFAENVVVLRGAWAPYGREPQRRHWRPFPKARNGC